MPIERFTKKEFEDALPEGWQSMGMEEGEHTYLLPLNVYVNCVIRSSISANGTANDAGEDSIRLWLKVLQMDGAYQPMKRDPELSSYTTRVTGWARRMNEKIDLLRVTADKIKRPIPICPTCEQSFRLRVTKKAGPNIGRPFASCQVHNGFMWMDVDEQAEIKRNDSPGAVTTFDTSQDLFAALAAGMPEEVVVEQIPDGRVMNEQQCAIIFAPTDIPIRVLAGPGSGKTSVLEKRIKFLVEQGAKPGAILYVTFSKTMAEEGKERIIKGLAEVVEQDDLEAYSRWFCTIHAACYRMLKEEKMGRNDLSKDWQVKKIAEPLIEEIWPLGNDERDPNRRPPIEEVIAAIDHAKGHGLTPKQDAAYFINMHGKYHGEKLHKIRNKIDNELRAKGLLTFADMLYECERMLIENNKIREKWQNQFQYVLIDEGQDVVPQALRILTMLAEPDNRFMIVGDADQTLYRFIQAQPENNLFDGFTERYPTGKLYFMEVNYRSTNVIVNAANNLIMHNYRAHGGPHSDEYYKILRVQADAVQGQHIGFVEYSSHHAEADGVAASIAMQLRDGYIPQQFFVSSRTKAQLAYLENSLMVQQVPFINIKGGSFWNAKHIKICVDYLRLAVDEQNQAAFQTVYNVATCDFRHTWGPNKGGYCNHRWLGAAFLAACNNNYQNSGYAASTKNSYKAGVNDLKQFIEHIQGLLEDQRIEDAINLIVEDCLAPWILSQEGEMAQGDESEGGKITDFAVVKNFAKRFKTPQEFFKFIDDALENADKAKNKDWSEFVVISTIHGLKGLERDVMYVVGVSEGLPNNRDEVDHGILPHTYSLCAPEKKGVLNFTSKSLLCDERSIFFVALTRARKEVYLSSISENGALGMQPSRFIREMGIQTKRAEAYEIVYHPDAF